MHAEDIAEASLAGVLKESVANHAAEKLAGKTVRMCYRSTC